MRRTVVSPAPSDIESAGMRLSYTPKRLAYSTMIGMPMSRESRTVIRLRDFSMPKRKVEGPAAEPAS